MLNKIVIAATVAIVLGTSGAASAQSFYGNNYGGYADQYGLGYSSTARHNPTDTNGF